MANLFSHKLLQETVQNITIPEMESKIEVLQSWVNAISNGSIKKKTESECEQAFNIDIFHKVLGYTFYPTEHYTLEAKGGNEVSGQKADATLGYFNTSEIDKNVSLVQVAVEIKDANTPLNKSQRREGNLSPIQQGFKYKPQYSNCKRVIVTNFVEIRLFKDTQLDYEIRQLSDLVSAENNYQNFKTFWYLLHAKHLISSMGNESVTEKLLSAVRIQSEQITKKFYQEYKTLRLELINDIRNNNPEVNLDIVIQKAQKVIDRIVFVHFCEDFGLLPDGKLLEVVKYAENHPSGEPIRKTLSGFFESVNSGSPKMGIPNGYNGGLFHEDKELNNLQIGDNICRKFVEIGKYNFQEDLSVNILGHIFEQSISDLEDLRINMLGTELETGELGESSKSNKRKKDGIFYTPEYIVDYIVRNSLGKYLEEQFESIEKKHLKNEKQMHDDTYQEKQQLIYREYKQVLENITVLDPACGSGAFLVKVFDYLLDQHRKVGEVLGTLFDNENTYKSILQKNIYGVDLNAESVEITKLSLRLKTAEKGKKLADLDNNIKCGNSLIDDPAVAGEKAFDWNKEFSQIFVKEEIKTWMITRAAHNTRISEKMMKLGIELGTPVIFDTQDEEEISNYIAHIAKQENLNVLAYNICYDHVHLILQCPESTRDSIVQKLKANSARMYNIAHGKTIPTDGIGTKEPGIGTREHAPLLDSHAPLLRGKTQNHLRGQKYNHSEIRDEKYLYNALEYVKTNREHHKLNPHSLSHQTIIDSMICTEYTFDRIQYGYSGGFDVIVGNPPYVSTKSTQFMGDEKSYFQKTYEVAEYQTDTYPLFVEKATNIIKNKGMIAYIMPNSWLNNLRYGKLRKFLLKKSVNEITLLPSNVFEDATVDTVNIFISKGRKNKSIQITEYKDNNFNKKHTVEVTRLLQNKDYIFDIHLNSVAEKLVQKIEKQTELIEEIFEVSTGIKEYQIGKGTPKQTQEDKNDLVFNATEKKDESFRKQIRGSDITNLNVNWKGGYVSYGPWLAEPRNPKFFEGERFVIRKIPGKDRLIGTVIEDDFVVDQSLYVGIIKNRNYNIKYISTIITSRLIGWYFRNRYGEHDSIFPQIKVSHFLSLPVKKISSNQQKDFIDQFNKIKELWGDFVIPINMFINMLPYKFPGLTQWTGKMKTFYEYSFETFYTELKKQGVKLKLQEEAERLSLFNDYKNRVLSIRKAIDEGMKKIDDMVFDLYELSEDERKVILDS